MHQVNSDNQNDDMDLDKNYYEEFQELEQKYSELEALKQRISNELNECSEEMYKYKKELDKKEDQVNEITEKYNQSEGKLKSLQTIYDEKLKEVQSDYTAICDENEKLKPQLESLSTENEKLKIVQSDYTTKCDENEKLKAQFESLSTENERLNKVQTDYRNENDEIKAQLESLSTENEKLNDQLSSFRKDNKIIRNKQKNDSNEFNKLKDEYEALKIHFENEKLKNNKHSNHSAVYNDNSNLKVQLKKIRSELTESKKNLEKILDENKILKEKASTSSDNYLVIQKENDRIKAQLKQFEDKPEIEDKNGKISEFQNKSNEDIKKLQEKNEEYFEEINDLKILLQKREKEKQDLVEKNNNLKKEASQYQSALGTITNYRMDDDDKNHSVQLKKDIEELQNKLKNYVTTLKGDCEIDFNAVKDLMEMYDIKTKVTSKKPNKPLIRAVLQYHIIKKITRDFRNYLDQHSEDSIMHLEAEIATKAKDLENILACFSKTRSGTDTVTQSASIKIRQEVNIALGSRGFSDISYEGKKILQEHAYIILKNTELNKEMNKYRIIKDESKRKYVEKSAADLIREFIRIVQFRLKVQEPSAQIRWIKIGSNIDPSIMEGSWDKDDIDNLEVEVCSFPMIGRDLDDAEKRKIYTNAQVFPKRKKNKFVTGLNNSFNYWSKKSKVNLELETDDDLHNGIRMIE